MKTHKIVAVCIAISVSAAVTVYGAESSEAQPKWAGVVDHDGGIHVPRDYRTQYEFLGSWAVAGPDHGDKELHVVYASPGIAAEYRKDKQFADGAVLVKEVFQARTA